MRRFASLVIAAVAVVALCAAPAAATIIFEETFEGLLLGPIHGQGGWTSTKAGVTNEGAVVEPGLSYQVVGGALINGGQHALQQVLNGESVSHSLPGLTETTYFRFLFQSPNTVGNTELFFRLDGWNTYLAEKYTAPLMEGRIGGGTQVQTATAENNQVHLIVGKLVHDGFGNFIALHGWFDPTPGDEASPDVIALPPAPVSDLTAFVAEFRHNNEKSFVDELRFATTWGEVVPVPEPSTLALLGVLAFGMAWMWKRRR